MIACRLLALPLIAILLAACMTASAFAANYDSPPCDEKREMTWSLPAFDPAKEVASLVEMGWETLGGKRVSPKVLAVEDIHRVRNLDTDKIVCSAIVETDQGNFEYNFWILHDLSAGTTKIHGVLGVPLIDKVPANIMVDSDGPYRQNADVIIDTYATIVRTLPACKIRSKDWGEALRQKILTAIPQDRADLIDSFARLSSGPNSSAANDCKNADNGSFGRYGDEVLSGKRSVWAVFD